MSGSVWFNWKDCCTCLIVWNYLAVWRLPNFQIQWSNCKSYIVAHLHWYLHLHTNTPYVSLYNCSKFWKCFLFKCHITCQLFIVKTRRNKDVFSSLITGFFAVISMSLLTMITTLQHFEQQMSENLLSDSALGWCRHYEVTIWLHAVTGPTGYSNNIFMSLCECQRNT